MNVGDAKQMLTALQEALAMFQDLKDSQPIHIWGRYEETALHISQILNAHLEGVCARERLWHHEQEKKIRMGACTEKDL